jgi:hypothetical protein
MVRLPDFIVIGAPKAGTTSLFFYLAQHPDIFLPQQKELHYFTSKHLETSTAGPGDRAALHEVCNSRKAYEHHYKQVGTQTCIGEVSPSYLYFSSVASQMKQELGHIKIIVSLRDPIQKAFSQYMHLVRDNRETLDFFEALQTESQRRKQGWSDFWAYAESSLYSQHLKRYLEVFGQDNIKVIIFEEMTKNPQGTMQDVFKFLGLDPIELKTDTSYNPSGKPHSKFLATLLSRPNPVKTFLKSILGREVSARLQQGALKLNMGDKLVISEEAKHYLRNYFSEDVAILEQILGRKLDWMR